MKKYVSNIPFEFNVSRYDEEDRARVEGIKSGAAGGGRGGGGRGGGAGGGANPRRARKTKETTGEGKTMKVRF